MSQISNSKRRSSSAPKVDRWMMRNAQTGQIVTVAERPSPAFPSTRALGKKLALDGDALAMLVKVFRAAQTKSRDAGSAMQFTVEVEPNGAPRIVTGEVEMRYDGAAETAEQDADIDSALEAARTRGRNRIAEILSQEDMLSAEAFAEHLNTTRATINTKRQAHQVLGLQGATRGFRYPEWQIGDDGRPFEVLPQLFDVLGGSPWAVYRFLVQEHPELDGLTGRVALRRGRDRDAISAAESAAQALA
jgi:hypothetical protein